MAVMGACQKVVTEDHTTSSIATLHLSERAGSDRFPDRFRIYVLNRILTLALNLTL